MYVISHKWYSVLSLMQLSSIESNVLYYIVLLSTVKFISIIIKKKIEDLDSFSSLAFKLIAKCLSPLFLPNYHFNSVVKASKINIIMWLITRLQVSDTGSLSDKIFTSCNAFPSDGLPSTSMAIKRQTRPFNSVLIGNIKSHQNQCTYFC